MNKVTADFILNKIRQAFEKAYMDSEVEALQMAIDALKQPEIIWCKKCKHYDEDEDEYGYKYGWCWSWGDHCDPDGFCNYAERRTDG